MTLIPVTLANGRTVEFEVRTGLEGASLFLLSVRKCGSSIFNNIAHAMAKANNCHYIDIGDTFFRAWRGPEWTEAARERHEADEKNAYPYSFLTLDRRRAATAA